MSPASDFFNIQLSNSRASSLSGQDFKPTIQAKGLAAYGSLGVPPIRAESKARR